MKTVLAIIASPRRLGNCELMAKAIARSIPQPHQLRLLRLPELRIEPCRACYRCLMGDGRCVIDDDFGVALDALASADGVILAVPTYFLGAAATLKLLLDRGLCFYARVAELWGKPSVGVAVAGIAGREGRALLDVTAALKLMLTAVKSTAVAYGALPGETLLASPGHDIARQLGQALFDPPAVSAGPRCPLCGGDSFRFLSAERVRCLVCSNQGTLHSDAAHGPRFEIERGPHELFLTREDVLAHGRWLMEMKARFAQHKAELKQVGLEYRHDGQWVQPAVSRDPAPHP
jgi:multimeric flavodoxin WrbA